MAGALPGVAIDIDQLRHRAAGHRDRHDAVACRACSLERFPGGECSDVERRPRSLCRPRQRGDVAEAMETSLAGDILLFEQQAHLLHPFVEASAAFIEFDAKARELMRQESAGKANVQPAIAQCVQHRELAGKLQRIVEGRQHGAGDEARALGELRRRREEHHRVGAVAAVWMKVVLDSAYMAIAVAVAKTDQRQCFLPIIARRLHLGADVGKKLDADLHPIHPCRAVQTVCRRVPAERRVHRCQAEWQAARPRIDMAPRRCARRSPGSGWLRWRQSNRSGAA